MSPNVAAKAATHKHDEDADEGSGSMTHQLTWQTTSGVRGLVCSKFRAVKLPPSGSAPCLEVTLASREEFESLLAELEMHFAAQRFADEAAALAAIKQYAFERANRKR